MTLIQTPQTQKPKELEKPNYQTFCSFQHCAVALLVLALASSNSREYCPGQETRQKRQPFSQTCVRKKPKLCTSPKRHPLQ